MCDFFCKKKELVHITWSSGIFLNETRFSEMTSDAVATVPRGGVFVEIVMEVEEEVDRRRLCTCSAKSLERKKNRAL